MTNQLMERIDEIIAEKSLLKHPFYEAWNKGELPVESLKEYATQYYHFERSYPTFISGLHHRCDNDSVRQLLLENLWDEEHGDENHVELWLKFCDSLGLDRVDVEEGKQDEATEKLVSTYKELTSTGSVASGAASLYAFESQIPAVASAKIEGLRDNYGIDNEEAVSFFSVHKTLDEVHSEAEREMVESLVKTEEASEEVVVAVQTATDALYSFLDGVYKA